MERARQLVFLRIEPLIDTLVGNPGCHGGYWDVAIPGIRELGFEGDKTLLCDVGSSFSALLRTFVALRLP